VTWVVDAGKIDAFVDGLAARLVAGAPVALAQNKALLNENADRALREALAGEARAQAMNFATADVPEAYAAFTQRRPARYTGRWAVPGTAAPRATEDI
jgi:2-(1,2-epoxy-1,2-dihydrophenyl)acetyl-CoA isomerase